MNGQYQQGMVLIMSLLYLTVITLLVLSAFELGWSQIKITTHLTDEVQALQNAETALAVAEAAVQGDEAAGQGEFDAHSIYQFKRRPESACGIIYYQIDATGTYAAAKSELESILLVPVAGQDGCPGEIPPRGEVSWRQLL